MEDLWKLQKVGYRVKDLADRAEYQNMLRRFDVEEERINRNNLLYGKVDLDEAATGKDD